MAIQPSDLFSTSDYENTNNRIGTIESMLSGVASGLIAIPKGFFSLGASIMDLGVNSGKAAAVEQWFDDLTEFDEKAEATAAGKITELIVNIGIPGGIAFKAGANLAKSAMLAGKSGKYVKLNNKDLVGAADEALELTAKGKGRQFIAGALSGGVGEGVFVGDAEKVGTFGDLIGGPTEINRSSTDPDATREILNRIKFGTEGALFTGILGGTGKVIRKITDRNKRLDVENSALDRWIDKVAQGFRARSGKTQEFFDIERGTIGAQAADTNAARNLSRDLEIDIDKLFPFFRNIGNKQTAKQKDEFLKDLNDSLLSGEAKLSDDGVATFGEMERRILDKDGNLIGGLDKIRRTIDEFAPDKATADALDVSITGGLSVMRSKWSDLFSKLGGSLSKQEITDFKKLFGNKFKTYLGSTYDIFQNNSILPFMRYKPSAQAIENAKIIFKDSYAQANPGKTLTDLQAEDYVANILKKENIGLPKGMRMDNPSEIYFKIPDFFVNRTTLDDAVTRSGEARASIGKLKLDSDKKVFNELYGKQQNPMQTMIGGMAKLSMITRRNLFYDDLLKKNDDVVATWTAAVDKRSVAQPMFAKSDDEARAFFGNADFRRVKVVDPEQRLAVSIASGATTPFGDIASPIFARNAVADALEKTGMDIAGSGPLGRLYESLVLYPKATSQIAKTILSPVTHLRNFVSAGAFAAANGILPAADLGAIKQAYQALQTPLKGTRQANDLYEELLQLGVVNSNVSLGDLSKLLKDVNFGANMTSDKGMRMLLKPLSKLKQVSQDLYTAEDDFWKIYSWAIEKDRLEKQFTKAGIVRGQYFKRNGVDIKLDDKFLKEEAADIVKNNIPNYDYVSDFVQGLRKLPIGNFVSFPAEIARTGTNIVRRALREINEEITLANGTVVKPFETIGYTRLFGFTTTVAAVPMATTAAFQALYDVTDEEREAIRRFAAQWSKNSTLLPIKDNEGNFKYVDFSHANAYDTLIRPLQSIINSVQDGRTDQDGMMDDFAKGLFTAMSEFAQPFVSEAIWTEAALDIIARGGRTRDGFQVYSDQDNAGDRNSKIMAHLVKAQMPFSFDQLKRLDRSIESVDVLTKGKFDKYGQEFEFGDEFQGLFGFRPVAVNPERTMNFKVANFQKGVRDSRSLFTRAALKGGPIEPREIVDAYLNSNRALFNVKKNLKLDMDAARLLNISDEGLFNSLDRVSAREINSIDQNIFTPLTLSLEVQRAFAENAEAIGVANPLAEAFETISQLQSELAGFSLTLPELPTLENPLMPIMQDTPLTPTSLNLPQVNAESVAAQVQGGNFTNLTNKQKFDLLFPNG